MTTCTVHFNFSEPDIHVVTIDLETGDRINLAIHSFKKYARGKVDFVTNPDAEILIDKLHLSETKRISDWYDIVSARQIMAKLDGEEL